LSPGAGKKLIAVLMDKEARPRLARDKKQFQERSKHFWNALAIRDSHMKDRDYPTITNDRTNRRTRAENSVEILPTPSRECNGPCNPTVADTNPA